MVQDGPLSAVPGLELSAVAESLKVFYSALFELQIGAFDRLLKTRLRERSQRKVAQLLATAYQVRCVAVVGWCGVGQCVHTALCIVVLNRGHAHHTARCVGHSSEIVRGGNG